MPSWNSLPSELKFCIIGNLDTSDVGALSMVNQAAYTACVSATFRVVKLKTPQALRSFVENVPPNYYRYIRELEISGPSSQQLAIILAACTAIETVIVLEAGSLDKTIIPCFARLSSLRRLTLNNCNMTQNMPLSERVAVAIAASIPCLQHLTLDSITRSALHAPELVGAYPCVPLVRGDDDVPDHPLLGRDLCLPMLLRIPTLRHLAVRDTHLGDPRWMTTPVECQLQVLDLGSCFEASEDSNRVCIERIMSAVGPTVDEFSLMTAVSDARFSREKDTPMPCLRKLHISPFFPVDSVVDTMDHLAGSPIESVSMQCYDDDVADVCAAVEDFLGLRASRGADYYSHLSRIDLTITGDGNHVARAQATKKLQDFCRNLGIGLPSLSRRARSATMSIIDERVATRLRRMTV
ncbi:hypothetical protein FISHEDRAFT_58920 [Fistulina hepatica ATCC 64428]|uniref:Uncharacterized protein n=1 Tax=Fistulina hepatica ATCC 64428 TaxID=1128425 RepID=A0A0D7AC57_9AGAR|nr:hypothetical protein FISHEDRAFT_58920 [Fistulina hepatica ATCC 64428]